MLIHPYSQRTLRNAAIVAEKYHRYDEALSIMETARTRLPGRIAIQLHWLEINCKYRTLAEKLDRTEFLDHIRTGYYRANSYEMLRLASEFLSSTACIEDHYEYSLQILTALEENLRAQKNPDILHQIHHIRGLIYLLHDKHQQAVISFKSAQEQVLHIESALLQVALLASRELYDAALEHLLMLKQQMDTDHKPGKLDYLTEIERLEKQIMQNRQDSNNRNPYD